MIDFSHATQSYNMDIHMDNWAADWAESTASRQIFKAGVSISTSTLQKYQNICYVILKPVNNSVKPR